MKFSKMAGAGNDFILVDADAESLPSDLSEVARYLCDRHFGVGADGLLVFKRQEDSALSINCINPDGSLATMCGNAVRCAAHYGAQTGLGSELTIEIGPHHLRTRVLGSEIEVTFPESGAVTGPLAIGNLDYFSVYTGTEHVVAFVDAVAELDVVGLGREVRYHGRFAPLGTNVNFLEQRSDGFVVRTYERGVEAETLSCGSGAVACALVAHHLGRLPSNEARIRNRTQTPLVVRVGDWTHPEKAVTLAGPAEIVFSGEFVWPR